MKEVRTRRSDRQGRKNAFAILEMRTALQGTRAAKSMQIKMTKIYILFLCCKILYSSKCLRKVHILKADFTIQVNCPIQNHFSLQLTRKTQKFKESQDSSQMKKFTTFSEASNKPKRRSKKQLFSMNCPIINLMNKQTDS